MEKVQITLSFAPENLPAALLRPLGDILGIGAQVDGAPRFQPIDEETVRLMESKTAISQTSATEPPVAPVPTAVPTYTYEQLARAAAQLMDAGKQNELIALIQKFGVTALNALPKEQYGPYALALIQMGAKI